ncbi:hypothetical protein ACTXT7_011629 [Hymenolepis weldensis]
MQSYKARQITDSTMMRITREGGGCESRGQEKLTEEDNIKTETTKMNPLTHKYLCFSITRGSASVRLHIQLQVAVDENPTCTTRELSTTFHVSRHMTIDREMKRLKGKVSKAGKLSPRAPPPPHDLSEINNQQRVTCCLSLRSRELQAPNHN